MATNSTSQVMQHLRRVLLQDGAGLTDGQLLGCFIEHRDEAAFAALVKRHGRLVWNVCRRLLDHHNAEDAFQATFLVLCRKAASIRRREMVASWLYGVAHQTALQARRAAARRRIRETQVVEMPEPAVGEQDLWNDLQPLLDQELSRLPDKYQLVILLCDLEGKTRKEVARQLRCAEGTVASRLARARTMLAARLAQRGLVVSGAALVGVLSQNAVSASVPTSVVSSTIKVANLIAAGKAAATGVISVKVAALTEGVLKTMLMTKLNAIAAMLVLVSLLGTGMYWLVQETSAGAQFAVPQQKQPKRKPDAANGQNKNNQEERDRQVDCKGRILFAWSPPGGKADPRGLASIRMDEKNEHLLFKEMDPLIGFDDGFRISPDRKKVAYRIYQRIGDGQRYAIHIRNLDPDSNPVDMKVDGQNVCWSPNSTQIAVSRGLSGNVIVDVATKKQTEIKLPQKHWVTDWSPDGTWFLVQFETDKGTWQLARMMKGDTAIQEIHGTQGGVWGGRISPDGKKLLFDRMGEKKASNLWVVNLKNGKPRQITQELNGVIRGYSWSPSGKRIAYTWVRFDPDSPSDPFEQETEAFLTVNDLEGKNPIILLSEKTHGTSAVHFTFWDWR